jgi:hypothetical protein
VGTVVSVAERLNTYTALSPAGGCAAGSEKREAHVADEEPRPLNYAKPDRRSRFELHWGGWVLVALVAVWAAATMMEWISTR